MNKKNELSPDVYLETEEGFIMPMFMVVLENVLEESERGINSDYYEEFIEIQTEMFGCLRVKRINFLKEVKKEIEEFRSMIPGWFKQGQELIFPERYDEWEKCVFARALDIGSARELSLCLQIMKALEKGATMEEVTKIFDSDNTLGERYSLIVRNIVFNFSSRGPEFWEATAHEEISPELKQIIEAKKQENIQLAKANELKNNGSKLMLIERD